MYEHALSASMYSCYWLFCIQGRLPPWVELPSSAALPFGAFEAVLQQPENAASAAAVQRLLAEQQPSLGQLEQLRIAVQALQANARLQEDLKAAFHQSGKHLLPHNVSAAALLVITCITGACSVPSLLYGTRLPFMVQCLCYNMTQCHCRHTKQRLCIPVNPIGKGTKTLQQLITGSMGCMTGRFINSWMAL